MLNLAVYKYKNSTGAPTSPIHSLNHSTLNLGGCLLHQVNAYLSPELKQLDGPERVLFGTVDGTGTHCSRLVATHMAISEALERWAWEHLLQNGGGDRYGFDLDSTTTGMAAFPGLMARQTRPHAMQEAVERWCLRQWWLGKLPCTRLESTSAGQHSIRVGNPISGQRVVISWSKGTSGLVAYGVACSRRQLSATWRARIEQERAERALAQFAKSHDCVDTKHLSAIPGYAERSFIYYAMQAGHTEFMDRVEQSAVEGEKLHKLTGRSRIRPVVDSSILGPWTPYAHVWRVLYPSTDPQTAPYAFYA